MVLGFLYTVSFPIGGLTYHMYKNMAEKNSYFPLYMKDAV